MWHCDDSFRNPQPLGSLFFCVEAPLDGAETWFASGTAALAALSPARQQQLAGLAAVHDYNTLNEILRVRSVSAFSAVAFHVAAAHVVQ
jgi:alpha-ketoglutarate-dependent taurine dioxygenase